MDLSEFYQKCGIPKGEPRKRTKARKKRVHRGDVAAVRAYVFGRERELCRCCRLRAAQSMHELQSRGAGGKVSKRNSVAVCGELVGVEPSCHTYLQANEIDWEDGPLGADGTLTFIPVTGRAAEWLRVKRLAQIESPVMLETEIAS